MTLYRGAIVEFKGSWGSGLGVLVIDDDRRGRVEVPCDNGPTVRALQAAFGEVIGGAHNVEREGGHVGKRIYYAMDEFGLVLGGFVPEDEAPGECVEHYETQEVA